MAIWLRDFSAMFLLPLAAGSNVFLLSAKTISLADSIITQVPSMLRDNAALCCPMDSLAPDP